MDRIIGVGIARVDEMDEEACAFDVAEESDAEPRSFVCAFDEAGKIGDDKSAAELGALPAGAAVGVDDPKIRFQRGKGIVGDFRARCGDNGNQSGLADIGVTHQADIGQKFKLEAKMALFSGKSVFVFSRSLMPRLGKVLIAAPAAATVGDQYALASGGEIGDGRAALIVEHQRADGNLQDHVLTGMTGAIGTFAVAAAIGLEFAIVAVAEQRVVVDVGFEIDAAAMAAVAAGGTTTRHVFFAPEGHAAVAAVAGLHEYFGFINEHRNEPP